MKNMKKIFTITALVFATTVASAQDDAASKNVRFGLMLTPSVDWYKSGEKLIEKNGASAKFGGGLSIEFRLTNVASLVTGAQVNMAGGKVKYNNNVTGNPSTSYVTYYYNNSDDVIAPYNSADGEINAYRAAHPLSTEADKSSAGGKYTNYLLNERKYQLTYITIPVALKLKTKEIGALKYYGMIGVNSSIRVGAKATDQVQTYGTGGIYNLGTPGTVSKIDIKKDVGLFNEALNVGLGVEWNLSGSTSLVIGANYMLGFTNVAKDKSDYLRKQTDPYTNGDGTELPQNLKSNSICLTIGVLF
ncbi:MAG: hypothetical protein JWP12_1673 [Bacteroidetes bacterium]|nr:hypothetical protein [Bacteroidota bacterium]